MKKMKIWLKITVFITAFLCCFGLLSCSEDKTGKHEFQKNMLSDFSAQVDFLVDFSGNPVAGKAEVTKSRTLRIDIDSPDPFSGISVECDMAGNPGVVSISYSGIKAEVPKAAMEKFLFLMNMMSEETALQLEKQGKGSYKPCEEMYVSEDFPEAVPYEVRLSYDNTEYIFIYDSITGIPLEIFADNGECKAEIKVRELKTANKE